MNSKICFVSGHYPKGVFFTDLTKRLLVNYCNLNDYDLYYDDFTKVDHVISEFHFRRCLIIKKASEAFPNADWYIWLDTDIIFDPLTLAHSINSIDVIESAGITKFVSFGYFSIMCDKIGLLSTESNDLFRFRVSNVAQLNCI